MFAIGMLIFTLFFVYRDGDVFVMQCRQALYDILGEKSKGYVTAIAETTHAVVYGIGFTAISQTILAGLGYWVAGAPSPALSTIGTFFIAFIPYGTPIAWLTVVGIMLLQGHTNEALGLALWCSVAVSSIDNFIQPMIISGTTEIPLMLIMLGVLGGAAVFGIVGIFLGPIILAVLLAVWRQWLKISVEKDTDNQGSIVLNKDVVVLSDDV